MFSGFAFTGTKVGVFFITANFYGIFFQ